MSENCLLPDTFQVFFQTKTTISHYVVDVKQPNCSYVALPPRSPESTVGCSILATSRQPVEDMFCS